MAEPTISLLICDDQEVVRKGLNTIFRYADGIEVVGLAVDGEDGVKQTIAAKPDVILMDLKMPKLNGIHATRRICTALPQAKVIVLTTFDTDEWVFDAVRAGASGYLLKDATGDELVTAVRQTHAGNNHLDPQIAGKILAEFNRLGQQKIEAQPDDPILEQLTEREMSILRLMAQGKTNQEIAEALFLALGTIKNNVSQILGKLHANDRTQAVLTALRRGIVDLE
jgi:DNA-binding NarL/FixJ family response regulator